MKKTILCVCALALSLTSCDTVLKTARTEPVAFTVESGAAADLDVSNRKIEYTYKPDSDVRRGGTTNVINTAIREALKANGGGDVLVETQKTLTYGTSLFGKKIKSVTVSGYPATYKNFRSTK